MVDLRQRSRGVSGRSSGALVDLGSRHRLLMLGPSPTSAPLDELTGYAQLVRPDVQVGKRLECTGSGCPLTMSSCIVSRCGLGNHGSVQARPRQLAV